MKDFCYNVFASLDIQPNGNLRPCCKFLNSEIPEQFNIKDGISKYKESAWLKDLQRQFIAGEKPKGCSRCWKEEDAGIKSMRQMDIEKHRKEFESLRIGETKFVKVQLDFGNICNLACRICGPGASSRWASEQHKEDGKTYPIHDWFKDKKIMKDLSQSTKNAVHIDIGGGEPLIVDITEHFEYLQHFVDSGRAREISLHYNTNGTTFPKSDHIDIWKQFKKVDLQLSIDDTGKRFEYNRWPANWKKVYANIKKYQKLCNENKHFVLSVSFSVSAFTIFYAEDFFKWCIKEGLPAPWMGVIVNPSYYNPQVLPQDAKETIRSRLMDSNIQQIKKLMNYIDDSPSKFYDQFKTITKKLDIKRNQNFQKTFPELAEILRY